MKMKALITVLLFTLFFAGISANTITDLNVDANIPLNQRLAIYGQYNDVDENVDVLCSFRVFNDENFLVVRLSDEVTASNGTFSSDLFYLNEPLIKRGNRYRVNVTCSTVSADAYFDCDQKEDLLLGIEPQGIIADFAFWTNRENSMTAVFTLIAFSVVIAVVGGVVVLVFKGVL